MTKFFAAVAAAIRTMFRAVWDPVRRCLRLVAETVPATVGGVAGAVESVASTVLSVPGNVIRSVLGGNAAAPTEGQAARKAAARAEATKERVTAVAQGADYGIALRSACRRLSRGRDLPAELVERLGSKAVSYLTSLDVHELHALAQEPPALVWSHIAGQRQANGVRSVEEVSRAMADVKASARRDGSRPADKLDILEPTSAAQFTT